MPCTPEELEQLATLLNDGKLGETNAISIDILPHGEQVTQNPAQIETNRSMGIMHNVRTQRGAVGDHMAVNAIDPLTKVDIKKNNFIAKEYKEYMEAVKPLLQKGGSWYNRLTKTMPEEIDIKLGQALENVDRGGRYIGAPGQFTPEILEAATKIRGIYDRLFTEFGIDPDTYLKGYRPLIKNRPDGIFRKLTESPDEIAFKTRLTPEQVIFYHELERKGLITDPDPKSSSAFVSYINGLGRAKILRPEVERLEKDVVNPFYGFKIYVSPEGARVPIANDAMGWMAWKETVHHMFGGPTQMDRSMTYNLQKLARNFGYDADTRSLYQLSQSVSSLYYSGALGFRPASAIKQITQIVPTYAHLGAKYTMIGLQKAMEPGSAQALMEKNVLSSPLDNLIEAVGVQRGVGRAISAVSETSLKAFSAVDRFTRTATYYGAEAKFDEYLKMGKIEKLGFMTKELKDEVLRDVGLGKFDAAKEKFAFTTSADLQYSFGRSNRPQAFRGALGNMVGMFMSYPLNTFEMGRMFAKRALPESRGGQGDPLPLIRLLAVNAGIVAAGSEFLNADLTSATLFGALPSSMALPKTALDTWNMGRTNAEWAFGSIFNIGETDFHKYQRYEADKAFARDMKVFMPGGLAFWEDIPRAIDEGSLVRMLAMTPKAAAINEQNRLKQQEAMSENANFGLPKLRALQ